MNITVNNEPLTCEEDVLSVNRLLQKKNYTFKLLVVKINKKLIPKEDYDKSLIHEGDDVIVLHLMSGG